MKIDLTAPIVLEHDGDAVVRDDLYPGGTKARFLPLLFDQCEELVYASPCEGGAQTAIATVAERLGKRATIFCAKRGTPHPRSLMAKRLGATILQVTPGYMSVCRKRASDYAADRGATLAPFGMDTPLAIEAIASAARATKLEPAEIWCAGGSGVLSRALARAWPRAERHCVQIGHALKPEDCAGATIHIAPWRFEQPCPIGAPFPADPHYDAKAWAVMRQEAGRRRVKGLRLFWNVTGPAEP